ncbi:MAG: phosphotriesterase [Christensenella sp.]
MKDFIRTVTGDIAPQELGYCQCHEHIFLEMDKSFEVSPVLFMDDYKKSVAELKEYQTAGGRAIVDAQPVACGRMAELLEKASAESGVHIVASTGFHKTAFYYDDSYVFKYNADEITKLYIEELEVGMYASKQAGEKILSCKAGQIKTAIDRNGIHANATYEKLFNAAADAAQCTGAPVMVHIEQNADALHVVDFFVKHGVAANRLVLCHIDRARYDFAYHKECAQTGAFMEYDTINRPKYHDDVREAELIEFMLGEGYAAQLLLGLDTTNARLRSYGAKDMGLDYILKAFIPFLEKRGIDSNIMLDMLVLNPQRALKYITNN